VIGVAGALAAIAARDAALGAFVHVDRTARPGIGALGGLAFAVKDTIDVAGWPGEANCRAFSGRRDAGRAVTPA
jgi:Asp-tRNA(Asn)/Glu-tRNA(Gln) amidotransferase A subunit family amidase